MPTLKNKKICEDVPPQLDLGPRPSFDSAHLDGLALGPVFRVYLLQTLGLALAPRRGLQADGGTMLKVLLGVVNDRLAHLCTTHDPIRI